MRDHHTIQVGFAPDRAVVVSAPVACDPSRIVTFLTSLRGGEDLGAAARTAGIADTDVPEVAGIIRRLADLGHIRIDRLPETTAGPDTPAPQPGLSAVRRIHIMGTGQVADLLRGPLSVNGCIISTSPAPGFSCDPDRPPWQRRGVAPDLVILAGTPVVDPVVISALNNAAQPHLHVYSRDGRVVVGPTVLPGHTTCLRCIDHYRALRDPCWPLVAAQLVGYSPEAAVPALTAAISLVLAEVVATRIPGASLQTLGCNVEINPAEGLWAHRKWDPIDRCDCGASTNPRPLSSWVRV